MKRKILTEVFAQRPVNTLYHYTTQRGLLGIVREKEIWATHNQYLNDTREYRHALELVREEIRSQIGKSSSAERQQILEEMDEDVSNKNGNGVRDVDGNVCVCSFSEESDSLSQWRAYAPANAGFAIGVRGEHLGSVAAQQGFYLARYIYDEELQRELIQDLILEVVDENAARLESGDQVLLPKGGNLHAYLHRYAPILKDPAFREEREWRVISRPQACTFARFGFREGNSMLIPYCRFPLELTWAGVPFSVHTVVVGPTPNPEISANSVRSFLVSRGLTDTLVANSKVPYRHW